MSTAYANLKEQKRYARFIGRRPSKRRVVALLMPRLVYSARSHPQPMSDSRLMVMQLRVQLGRISQGRATVDDVEVLSILPNISMAVLFVVLGWSTHESYVQ